MQRTGPCTRISACKCHSSCRPHICASHSCEYSLACILGLSCGAPAGMGHLVVQACMGTYSSRTLLVVSLEALLCMLMWCFVIATHGRLDTPSPATFIWVCALSGGHRPAGAQSGNHVPACHGALQRHAHARGRHGIVLPASRARMRAPGGHSRAAKRAGATQCVPARGAASAAAARGQHVAAHGSCAAGGGFVS